MVFDLIFYFVTAKTIYICSTRPPKLSRPPIRRRPDSARQRLRDKLYSIFSKSYHIIDIFLLFRNHINKLLINSVTGYHGKLTPNMNIPNLSLFPEWISCGNIPNGKTTSRWRTTRRFHPTGERLRRLH